MQQGNLDVEMESTLSSNDGAEGDKMVNMMDNNLKRFGVPFDPKCKKINL